MDNRDITGHISSTFNDELVTLSTNVLAMGSLVHEQIRIAVEALNAGEDSLAEKITTNEQRIDMLERQVDEDCMRIIARRQPAASDLRFIMAMTKTVTDLERMGDEAERIGFMAMRLAGTGKKGRHGRARRGFFELTHLGGSVLTMVEATLQALRERDTEAAAVVVRNDLEVDHEYEAILRQAMTYMMEDPRSIPRVLNVMWAARSLERIGDRARNICEYVIYLVKGTDVRHTSLENLEREAQSPD